MEAGEEEVLMTGGEVQVLQLMTPTKKRTLKKSVTYTSIRLSSLATRNRLKRLSGGSAGVTEGTKIMGHEGGMSSAKKKKKKTDESNIARFGLKGNYLVTISTQVREP